MPTVKRVIPATTTTTVTSEEMCEDIDLGTLRKFVAECDAAGIADGQVVTVEDDGDLLRWFAVRGTDQTDQPPIPGRIDWATRQLRAVVQFPVVDGRPVNPCAPTGRRWGQGGHTHWGERAHTYAAVTTRRAGRPRLLYLVQDGTTGWWTLPEYPDLARHLGGAGLELVEAAGPAAVLPDPRSTDEAWLVGRVICYRLRDETGPLPGGEEIGAGWFVADTYDGLLGDLQGGSLAYPTVLRGLLAGPH